MSLQPMSSGDGRRPKLKIFTTLAIPLLALILITGFFTFHVTNLFQASRSALASDVIPFSGTISPLMKRSQQIGSMNSQSKIDLSIGLRPRNLATLTGYVQDMAHPKSANYHRYLNSAQVASLYAPSISAQDTVMQFLQSSGFTITHTYNHRLLITVSGTVAQVEQAFHVTLNDYQAADGHTFYANGTEPQVPANIAPLLQSISGLNNATRLTHPRMTPGSTPVALATVQGQASSCPQNVAQNWLNSAYDISGLTTSYRGQGQTVALYELATFQNSDISAYEACFAPGAHIPVQTIVTGQGTVPSDDGIAEVELDAELVTSVAPQLGTLKIYEAANDPANRLAEWAQIVQDAPAVVSTSWGGCEQLSDPNEISQENVFFTMAAAQGQTILASSGDSGSEGCMGQVAANSQLNAIDPAAQPFVTAVGGTSVIWNGTRNESTWNDQSGASGGGISQYWTAPAWQTGPGVNNSYTTGTPCHATGGAFCREIPDISLNADPVTGYAMYCASKAVTFCNGHGPWFTFGGTSAAAPVIAAMTALQNQYLLAHGSFNVGFLNPLLYQIAAGGNASQNIHDITQGPSNDFQAKNAGAYATTAGYDLATGLGSPDAAHLASAYLSLSNQRSSPANNTWYFAEGSVGGGFQEYITLQNPSSTAAAQVSITYLFESSNAVTVNHTVNASTRFTVSVNADLHIPANATHQSISAIVRVMSGGPGIVAERPMYFNFHGIQSGTDVVGTTSPATSYYFPEADTRNIGRTYATYLTMLNPSTTQSAHVVVTYYTGHCGLSGQANCPTQAVTVLPLHRGTATPLAFPLYQQMSVKVTSDLPVVVERPMYFNDTIANAGGHTTGAASEIGATNTGTDWLFAEGYTGTNFQEYLVLANFGTTATTAAVQLKYENGHTQTLSVPVPALGQTYFDVNNANAHPTGTCDVTPCSTTPAVSAEVTATAPIVADRLMYFHFGGNRISGGTDAVGEAGPAAHNVYAFAEGYTAGSFSEYLTLQNPTNNPETVAVTLFVDTYIMQEQVTVKAHSRRTVGINALVTPVAQAYPNLGSNSYSVSMTIQALGNGATIVAERPMYFNYSNADQGGTDVLGYVGG